MTAGAQNIKKETVNESQSRGQNNGGQTQQRFTGGDERTAQRRVERRSTALGIRRVQTKTPRDRRTARRAGAGTKGRQTQVWARAEANCASDLAADCQPQASPPGREAGRLLSETFRQFLIKRNRRFGARSRDPAFPRLGVRLPGRNGNARPHKADVNAHGNARGGLTHNRNKAGHDIDPSPHGR